MKIVHEMKMEYSSLNCLNRACVTDQSRCSERIVLKNEGYSLFKLFYIKEATSTTATRVFMINTYGPNSSNKQHGLSFTFIIVKLYNVPLNLNQNPTISVELKLLSNVQSYIVEKSHYSVIL